MPTSVSDVLRRALSEAAWAQWTTLGVLGATPIRESRCIDPEALVWLTFTSDVADTRLVDIARDWLALNKHLVSIHRLRNVFGDDKDALERLTLALRANVERPKARFEIAAKTTVPDPMIPANLSIRLRYLMDAGVRSEVVRYLITQPGRNTDAQAVADAAMFAKRNVNDTLLSLVHAGVVADSWMGNRRVFSVDEERWCAFIGIRPIDVPDYMPWVKILRAATAILHWLEADKRTSETPYMRSSRARSLVMDVRSDLAGSGINVTDATRALAEAFLVPFDALVSRVADAVAPHPVGEVHGV